MYINGKLLSVADLELCSKLVYENFKLKFLVTNFKFMNKEFPINCEQIETEKCHSLRHFKNTNHNYWHIFRIFGFNIKLSSKIGVFPGYHITNWLLKKVDIYYVDLKSVISKQIPLEGAQTQIDVDLMHFLTVFLFFSSNNNYVISASFMSLIVLVLT